MREELVVAAATRPHPPDGGRAVGANDELAVRMCDCAGHIADSIQRCPANWPTFYHWGRKQYLINSDPSTDVRHL